MNKCKVIRTESKIDKKNNAAEVWVFTRNDAGEQVIIKDKDFFPYFYIPEDEVDKAISSTAEYHNPYDWSTIEHEKQTPLLVDFETNYAVDGTPVRRVYCDLPSEVPYARDRFTRTWEADVPFATRYLIDKVDEIEQCEPRILLIDIEVDTADIMPDAKVASDPVICISTHDNYTDTLTTWLWQPGTASGVSTRFFRDRFHTVYWCRDEKDMFQQLADYMKKNPPDVLSGWYAGEFDLPYIINRMSKLEMMPGILSPMFSAYVRDDGTTVIKGISTVDVLDAYRFLTQNEEESYRLDYIARKLLGEGKSDTANNVGGYWRFKPEKLIEYNVVDVLLVHLINKDRRLLDFLDELRRTAFCQLEDTLSMGKIADCYILKLFHGSMVFPTKDRHEHTPYEGALVGLWAKGIQERTSVFDVRSLYPSLMISANLSPETVRDTPNEKTITIDGVHVDMSFEGFLPKVVKILFESRAKYKKLQKQCDVDSVEWKIYDARQWAFKILMNALYGQTAYDGSRLYEPRIAKTITFLGRNTLLFVKKVIEDMGFSVVYADTDSIFWVCRDLTIAQIEDVLKIVNQSFDIFCWNWNLKSGFLVMEFEKIYRKIFFGEARKRYYGHIVWKGGKETDKVEGMGFETRRSDSAPLTKKILERLFEMVLREDKTKTDVIEFIRGEIDRLRRGEFDWNEIGVAKGISKPLDEYGKLIWNPDLGDYINTKKGIPAHVRGSIIMRDKFGVRLSTKPRHAYTIRNEYYPSDVVSWDETWQIPGGTKLDMEKTLEKLVGDKVRSIFKALRWRMNDISKYWKHKLKKGEVVLEQLPMFELEEEEAGSKTKFSTEKESGVLVREDAIVPPINYDGAASDDYTCPF